MARASLGIEERRLLSSAPNVVGIDEVGRGCRAGPVVVAGVTWGSGRDKPLIQDSKTLTPRQRETAHEFIRSNCADWLVIEVWVDLIDRLNILEATRVAMRTVARRVAGDSAWLVIDNVDLGLPHERVLSCRAADATYFCVASASIMAKVHRDRLMVDLGRRYGIWSWQNNKGYGTVAHRRALTRYGRSFLHRSTFGFSPVLP